MAQKPAVQRLAGRAGLRAISDASLTDGQGLVMQSHQREWIVEYQGEFLGSMKKKKGGWDLDPMYQSRLPHMARAATLIDAAEAEAASA